MSLALYMEPIKPPKPTYLGKHPLKGLMCSAFGEHDGSLREEFVLTRDRLPELQVLLRTNTGPQADEVREGIEKIIDAINQHGAVRVYTDE